MIELRHFCPYCGSTRLKAKPWRKEQTWFVSCLDCAATGPSLAKSEAEAWKLFEHRANGPVQTALYVGADGSVRLVED